MWLDVFLNEASSIEENSTSVENTRKLESTAKTYGQSDATTLEEVNSSLTSTELRSKSEENLEESTTTSLSNLLESADDEVDSGVDEETNASLAGGQLTLAGAQMSVDEAINNSVDSVKTARSILDIIRESKQTDLFITLKSGFSEEVYFNSLKTPVMTSEFVYNHFDINEDKINVKERENKDLLKNKSLNDVPMYIKLDWNTSIVENKIEFEETDKSAVKTYTEQDRGAADDEFSEFKNSYEKSKARDPKLAEEDKTFEFADTHSANRAFDSSSNNKISRNNISSVVNMSTDSNIDSVTENAIKNLILSKMDQ